MAEAEYAAGPRLISDSNSFTAWSDVPENLCKTILRLLPNGPIFLRRVETSTCKSGWLAGCALCTSALWAVKVKGRHGDNYHAEGLESHFARDARHHPDVSAADRAHRRHSLTHSLPTPPHMCVWHTCVPACVRGMCAAACLDAHFHRHMPRHTHAMDCTYAYARACVHWPSLCATIAVRLLLYLLDGTHARSCSDAHPPPRRSPPRSLGTAVPCAQPRCHQASPLTLPGATVLHVRQRSAQNSMTRVQRVRVRKSSAHTATTTNCSRQASGATTSATVKQAAWVPRGRAESGRVKVPLEATRNVSMLNL
jgi:hypothetical protein